LYIFYTYKINLQYIFYLLIVNTFFNFARGFCDYTLVQNHIAVEICTTTTTPNERVVVVSLLVSVNITTQLINF